MNRRIRNSLLVSGAAIVSVAVATVTLYAGQAAIVPLTELVRNSGLIAVVEVQEVTQVDVPTDDGQFTSVFVAQAVIQETLKSDVTPVRKHRKIAIVGSTIPRSSAVWTPIKKGRYLAFLKNEQGHYRFGLKFALREIDSDENVVWYEYSKGRDIEFFDLPLREAILRVEKAQQGTARRR